MIKHTPGPWIAAGKHITQDDGGVVAYTTAYAKPTPRQVADARLIAAAPELLGELRKAREFIHMDRVSLADAHNGPDGLDEDSAAAVAEYDEALARIDAAIAKASGTS